MNFDQLLESLEVFESWGVPPSLFLWAVGCFWRYIITIIILLYSIETFVSISGDFWFILWKENANSIQISTPIIIFRSYK